MERWSLIYKFISWTVVSVKWCKFESGKKIIQDRTIYEDAHILHPTCMRWA
jgi:hypothetical protein